MSPSPPTTMTTIDHLPSDILSIIFEYAAMLNLRDCPKWAYGSRGLMAGEESERPGALPIRYPRAYKCPDTVRWITTDAIRQVKRTWHDWACQYSLQSIYLSRSRGSERWLESRTLEDPSTQCSGKVVYRDPDCSLKKTARLFQNYPQLACSVQRIWCDGYHDPETNAMIMSILRNCRALRYVTVPWTTLRHGSAEEWSFVCGPNRPKESDRKSEGGVIESLEFRAVNLNALQMHSATILDRVPLLRSIPVVEPEPDSMARVDFSHLSRLKITGRSNYMPLTDLDLIRIARTATKLRELCITTEPGSTSGRYRRSSSIITNSSNSDSVSHSIHNIKSSSDSLGNDIRSSDSSGDHIDSGLSPTLREHNIVSATRNTTTPLIADGNEFDDIIITRKGISALVRASWASLQLVEYQWDRELFSSFSRFFEKEEGVDAVVS